MSDTEYEFVDFKDVKSDLCDPNESDNSFVSMSGDDDQNVGEIIEQPENGPEGEQEMEAIPASIDCDSINAALDDMEYSGSEATEDDSDSSSSDSTDSDSSTDSDDTNSSNSDDDNDDNDKDDDISVVDNDKESIEKIEQVEDVEKVEDIEIVEDVEQVEKVEEKTITPKVYVINDFEEESEEEIIDVDDKLPRKFEILRIIDNAEKVEDVQKNDASDREEDRHEDDITEDTKANEAKTDTKINKLDKSLLDSDRTLCNDRTRDEAHAKYDEEHNSDIGNKSKCSVDEKVSTISIYVEKKGEKSQLNTYTISLLELKNNCCIVSFPKALKQNDPDGIFQEPSDIDIYLDFHDIATNDKDADQLFTRRWKMFSHVPVFVLNDPVERDMHYREKPEEVWQASVDAGCFTMKCTQFVCIDSNGRIYVTDFVKKDAFYLQTNIHDANVILASETVPDHYFVGTKTGCLFEIDISAPRYVQAKQLFVKAIKGLSFNDRKHFDILFVQAVDGFSVVYVRDFNVSHDFFNSRTFKFSHYNAQVPCYIMIDRSDNVAIKFKFDVIQMHNIKPIEDRRAAFNDADRHLIPKYIINTHRKGFSTRYDQPIPNGLIASFCVMEDGSETCYSTWDGSLLFYNSTGIVLTSVILLRKSVFAKTAYAVRPEGRYLFGRTAELEVMILDLTKPALINVVGMGLMNILVSWDSKFLVTFTPLRTAKVWNMDTLIDSNNTEITKQLPNTYYNNVYQSPSPPKRAVTDWEQLLKLPYNLTEFQKLVDMGRTRLKRVHTNVNIVDRFPRLNGHYDFSVMSVWSCLCHWNDAFEYVEYMPHFIQPFAKYYSRNEVILFEIMITLFRNQFFLFFENFPFPSNIYVQDCANLIKYLDPQLAAFYDSIHATPYHYAWPLFATAFGKILGEDQWLHLWDQIWLSPPSFCIHLVAAFNVELRFVLMSLSTASDVRNYFETPQLVNVYKIVDRALGIMQNAPAIGFNVHQVFREFETLPMDKYPEFNCFPRTEMTAPEFEEYDRLVKWFPLTDLDPSDYQVCTSHYGMYQTWYEFIFSKIVKYVGCQGFLIEVLTDEVNYRKNDMYGQCLERPDLMSKITHIYRVFMYELKDVWKYAILVDDEIPVFRNVPAARELVQRFSGYIKQINENREKMAKLKLVSLIEYDVPLHVKLFDVLVADLRDYMCMTQYSRLFQMKME